MIDSSRSRMGCRARQTLDWGGGLDI